MSSALKVVRVDGKGAAYKRPKVSMRGHDVFARFVRAAAASSAVTGCSGQDALLSFQRHAHTELARKITPIAVTRPPCSQL